MSIKKSTRRIHNILDQFVRTCDETRNDILVQKLWSPTGMFPGLTMFIILTVILVVDISIRDTWLIDLITSTTAATTTNGASILARSERYFSIRQPSLSFNSATSPADQKRTFFDSSNGMSPTVYGTSYPTKKVVSEYADNLNIYQEDVRSVSEANNSVYDAEIRKFTRLWGKWTFFNGS
jgi:hypothetical protein